MCLTCNNCKYLTYSKTVYCSLDYYTLTSITASNMKTCECLIKKLNQIYFNRFVRNHHIEDKQLISNCKKILNIVNYILLDELIYAMVDNRGPFVELLWVKKDKEDCGFSIKIFKDEIYIQVYQMEKYKIHTYESFSTSLHLNMKDFKEKEQVVKNILWTTMAIYLNRYHNIDNANQELQNIFNTKIIKEK